MRRKRAFDLVVVGTAALVWVPVVAVAAMVVLIGSGRPVFYRSRRWVGARRVITMIKFRVMVPNADKIEAAAEGDTFLNHPSDSPLYTRPGRLLERWGLTELPQFLHVLSGTMSVVGARPLTAQVNASLRGEHTSVDSRFETPAGLTGPPQLVGRDALSGDERLHLEATYCHAAARGYRFRLDFMILLYTVLIVLRIKEPLSYHGALDLLHRHSALRPRQFAVPFRSTEAGSVAVD